MATLWIEDESGGYTQLGFSTGYTFGFYGLPASGCVKIIGGGRIEKDKQYLIKKVKIYKGTTGSGFWWLGESAEAYFDSFKELMKDLAPGCLTKRCVISQLIIEEV